MLQALPPLLNALLRRHGAGDMPAPGAKWWMRVNQKEPLTSREETLRMGGILWETLSNTTQY